MNACAILCGANGNANNGHSTHSIRRLALAGRVVGNPSGGAVVGGDYFTVWHLLPEAVMNIFSALTIARRFDGEAELRGATLFFFDPYGSARSAMKYELNITFVEQAQTGDGFTSW
jgi:hypothetical protein